MSKSPYRHVWQTYTCSLPTLLLLDPIKPSGKNALCDWVLDCILHRRFSGRIIAFLSMSQSLNAYHDLMHRSRVPTLRRLPYGSNVCVNNQNRTHVYLHSFYVLRINTLVSKPAAATYDVSQILSRTVRVWNISCFLATPLLLPFCDSTFFRDVKFESRANQQLTAQYMALQGSDIHDQWRPAFTICNKYNNYECTYGCVYEYTCCK